MIGKLRVQIQGVLRKLRPRKLRPKTQDLRPILVFVITKTKTSSKHKKLKERNILMY